MLNIYDYITQGNFFRKFEVNDLLFVEYKCMIEEARTGYWTHNNYFIYTLSGKRKWTTDNKEYVLEGGEAIFIKKGAYIVDQYTQDDFCALLIFVPDDYIKSVLSLCSPEYFEAKNSPPEPCEHNSIIPLYLDESFSTYFHSVLSYFSKSTPPPKGLLQLKFQELILNVLTNPKSQSLASYFYNIHESNKVCIRSIMETCFMHHMALEEYAKLCARSLSSFKADFQAIYKTSPGKWLMTKRLERAKFLIETTEEPVNDIAFRSGFKNTSHLVRLFKETYGRPPHQYRLIRSSDNLNPVFTL